MKKAILALLACGTVWSAGAQMHMMHDQNKENGGGRPGLLVYGDLMYNQTRGNNDRTVGGITTNTDAPTMHMFRVSPGIGYSFNNNLAVGIDFTYQGTKTDINLPTGGTGMTEDRTREIGVGPFIRHSVLIGEHFFAYHQLTFNYINGRNRRDFRTTPNQEDTYDGVSASLMPALGVRITPMIGLAFGFGGISYRYTKTNDFSAPGTSSETKASEINVTLGRQFNLTLQRYCNWGHKKHGKGHRMPMDDARRMDMSDDAGE